MSGIFGVALEKDCLDDLFFGTDYHSHLGTRNGGLAIANGDGFHREIKGLCRQQFRSQFESFKNSNKAGIGIGVISDAEPQPLIIQSHLGDYGIVHVGRINNLENLVSKAKPRGLHFLERDEGKINPVEVLASLINQGNSYEDGLQIMQDSIDGSSSIMLLTSDGIFLARDKLGRTPIVVGKKEIGMAAATESCSFPNQGFEIERYLGPGEIGFLTHKGYEQLKPPGSQLQICSFLWIYYGYPASNYEGINTEIMRNRSGAIMGKLDEKEGLAIDFVAGIPDSGVGHGLGYSHARKIPYKRPYVKYTPTWPRSFMPINQDERDVIAGKKLIPIRELVEGQKILFCEDSIVRGTQLKDTIQRLADYGAQEIHMRPACPPLTDSCRYLNFSRSKSVLDLAARKAIKKLDGKCSDVDLYRDETTPQYGKMVDTIRKDFGLKSLKYQTMDNLVSSIGLAKESLCLGCWRECTGCK